MEQSDPDLIDAWRAVLDNIQPNIQPTQRAWLSTCDPVTVHDELAEQVSRGLLADVLGLVPDAWLLPDPTRPDPQAPPDAPSARRAYADYLLARLAQAERWLP